MAGKADHLREDRVSAIRRVMVIALHRPMLALLSWFTLSAAHHRDPETPFLVAMAASPAIGLGVALAGWYRRSADWIVLLDGVLAGFVALFAFGLFVISPPALVGDPIRGLGVALFLASLLAAGAGASQIDGRTASHGPMLCG